MKIPAQYAKAIAGALGYVLLWLQYKYGAANEWVLLATGVAGTLGIVGVPNAPKPAPPAVTTSYPPGTPPAV